MNTNIYTRTAIVFSLFALLLTACGSSGAKQTQTAIYEQAIFAMDTSRAVRLQNGASYDDITADAIAISAVITAQKGAFMLLNDCQHLAVFISPAGANGNGGAAYYLYTFIDTSKTALLSANRILSELGIGDSQLTSIDALTTALRERGFTPVTTAALPTLATTLRLGMGFLRSLGGTISHVILVPALMLSPEQIAPWCGDGQCIQVKQ
jgi:hypothetical protein